MSLNPELGHLYHDGSIQSVFTALDVQDKLRTREINARETKTLDKYLHILDRAKSVCRRRNEFEQRHVKEELSGIKSKSPTLKSSLRKESMIAKNLRLENGRRSTVTGSKLPSLSVNSADAQDVRSRENKKDIAFVSLWSVYSDGNRVRNFSAPEGRKFTMSRENRILQTCDAVKSAKTPSYVKRTEQITSSLHKLFSQSRERKFKESSKTVLEVLGKGSKEELEKALFVLRGTRIGNVIEDILHERQLVTEQPKSKSSPLLSDLSSEESENGDFMEKTDIENNSLVRAEVPQDSFKVCGMQKSEQTAFGNVEASSSQGFQLPTLKTLSNPGTEDNDNDNIDLNKLLKRDKSINSSNFANPSEKSTAAAPPMKWTELFKAPELWKQSQDAKRVKVSPKMLNIVTITGKRRQTMLKRR